jgi:hypothetical protein
MRLPCTDWTEEEISLLKYALSLKSLTYDKIHKRFFPSRSRYSIQGKVQKLGLKNNSVTSKKYFYNDNYFLEYTLENCYFAGYFMADSSIGISHGLKTFSWSVAEKDIEVMKLFNNIVGFGGKIRKEIRTCSINDTSGKLYTQYKMRIVNCKWIPDLENKFGITVGKTYRNVVQNFPTLEHELAFLIGIIDGDGSITRMYRDNTGFCISLVSCSLPTIEWFKKTVTKLNLPSLSWKDNKITFSGGCHRYQVRGCEAAFLFELLKAIPVPKLSRKWNNPDILECVEHCKKRYYDSARKDPKKAKLEIQDQLSQNKENLTFSKENTIISAENSVINDDIIIKS